MHRCGIRILAAAAGWTGLSAAAMAQSAHAPLAVSATVTRSCTFSSGAQVACAAGTGWTRSVRAEAWPAAGPAYPAKSLQGTAPSDPNAPKILFVTISF